MEQYTTFKKLVDKLEEFANKHPNINSFGFGNLVEFGKDVENTTPLYPLLFVVPQGIQYNEGITQYQLQVFLADKLNDDLDGSVDIVSEMSLISKDLLGTFKLNPDFMYLGDFDFPVNAAPFMERFNDMLAGVSTTISFNVSDYLDICQLNEDLGPQLYLDLTRSDYADGTNRYSGAIFISRYDNETGDGGLWWNLETEEGIAITDEYPKRVQVNIPLDDEPNKYRYSVFALGYSEPIFGAELLNGNEPFSSSTCNVANIFTFTGDGKTDWYWNVSPDYDCVDYPEFNVYTSDGFLDDGNYPIEWRMEIVPDGGGDTRYYPAQGDWVEIRAALQGYNFTRQYVDGDEVTIYIRDNRAGQGDTFMNVELNGTEVYTDQCYGEIEYSFTLTGESTHDVYLQGRIECAPLPTPTPSPTLTPSATLTPTPTITPSPTITPTPSATPGPAGPTPPSGMVMWYDFQDDLTMSITSSGGTDYITGIDNKAPSYLGNWDLTNDSGTLSRYPVLTTNITGFTGHAHTGQTNGAQGAEFIDTAVTSDRRWLHVTGGTQHDFTGYTFVHIMKYTNPSSKTNPIVYHGLLSSNSSSYYANRFIKSGGLYLYDYASNSFSSDRNVWNLTGDYQDVRDYYFADTLRMTGRFNYNTGDSMVEHNNTFIDHYTYNDYSVTGVTRDTFGYGIYTYNNGSSSFDFYDGDAIVLETIIYDRDLNDSDWTTLETYLDYKYGNPIDIAEAAPTNASGWTENIVNYTGVTGNYGTRNDSVSTRFQLFGDIQIEEWARQIYSHNDMRMLLPRRIPEVSSGGADVAVEIVMTNYDKSTFPGALELDAFYASGGTRLYGVDCNGLSQTSTFYDWNYGDQQIDAMSVSDCVLPIYSGFVQYTGETGMVVRFTDLNNGDAEIATLSGTGVQTLTLTGESGFNFGIYGTGGTASGNVEWIEYSINNCDPGDIDSQNNSNCGPTTSNSTTMNRCYLWTFQSVNSC
jgi:hypothetical protein